MRRAAAVLRNGVFCLQPSGCQLLIHDAKPEALQANEAACRGREPTLPGQTTTQATKEVCGPPKLIQELLVTPLAYCAEAMSIVPETVPALPRLNREHVITTRTFPEHLASLGYHVLQDRTDQSLGSDLADAYAATCMAPFHVQLWASKIAKASQMEATSA